MIRIKNIFSIFAFSPLGRVGGYPLKKWKGYPPYLSQWECQQSHPPPTYNRRFIISKAII